MKNIRRLISSLHASFQSGCYLSRGSDSYRLKDFSGPTYMKFSDQHKTSHRSNRAQFDIPRYRFWQRQATSTNHQYFHDRFARCYGTSVGKLVRNSSFSLIHAEDISHFHRILGEKNVIQDEDALENANCDWMRKYKGSSRLLLRPQNTEQVSQILMYCNSRHLAVVPQGGNTGLVGGSVPVFDEIIVNLGSLNKIISFDERLLSEAKEHLGEIISAFEFLDHPSLDMVLEHSENVRNPLPSARENFFVLIETTGSNALHDKEKLDSFLEKCLNDDLISDGTIAQDYNQAEAFWKIREGIAEALGRAGAVYKYDLSIPVQHLYEIVEEMQNRLGAAAKVLGYGHLGDGNIHLNISTPNYDEKILEQIEPFVYEWTSRHRGSISAEHGLGLMKANKIYYNKPAEAVHLMASLKNVFDPKGILNPYKVLPYNITTS